MYIPKVNVLKYFLENSLIFNISQQSQFCRQREGKKRIFVCTAHAYVYEK